MGILRLNPACKDYLWGGHRLVEEYGIKYNGDVLAETWELSCHPDGPSTIASGPFAGKTLTKYIRENQENGREVLGKNCRRFSDFPVLIKFIDAKKNLSIQVHPDNSYALKNENQYGKTEIWYVMDAEPGAFLYYGFEREVSKEELQQRIEDDTLTEVLHAEPVKKGDVLFIEPGTIHAIGQGILLAEIQQNSNVTYRVYDYGRVGKDGKKRELHIDKALDVTRCTPVEKKDHGYPHVADCDYFTVDSLVLNGTTIRSLHGCVTEDSFVSLLVLEGEGSIVCKDDNKNTTADNGKKKAPTGDGGEKRMDFQKGDSLFLPAGSGRFKIKGSCHILMTTIRGQVNKQ